MPRRAAGVGAGLDLGDAEQREHREDRDDGDVLEQQHRERGLAAAGLELAALGQRRQHDRRRRHRHDQPDRERRAPRHAERQRAGGDHRGRRRDLQPAEAEDRSAQPPQERRLQLEADHEQHHHDAELGEVHDVLALAADRAEHVGADQHAGHQVAQHRAQPEPLGDRHAHHRGAQVDERLEQDRVGHATPPAATRSVGARWAAPRSSVSSRSAVRSAR
jgi:hypothetical protein